MQEKKKRTVLVLDSHAIYRTGLSFAINTNPAFSVIAECDTVKEGVEAAKNLAPDIVIIGIDSPGFEKENAIGKMRKALPGCKLLAISIDIHPGYAEKMIKKGADAFVAKTSPLEILFKEME